MKLKKTLAGALVLCLAMGAAGAMAENTMTGGDTPNTTATTEVKLVIDRSLDKYTITIPANVEIDPRTKEGTGTITLSDKDLDLVSATSLYVQLTAAKNPAYKQSTATKAHFTLVGTGKKGYDYYIKKKDGTAVEVGDVVLSYTRSSGQLSAPETETLTYYVISLPTEGTYTDTLTFSVTF